MVQFTLCCGPTIQTKLYLMTNGILYNKSASFTCDGRLFRSLGPAAANALIAEGAVCPRHCMHVRLAVYSVMQCAHTEH